MIKENTKYTKKHEWVCIEGEKAIVGITDYAQNSLGDITFVDMPQIGREVKQFGEICSVESVKAASDIYSPLSGKICEVNKELESSPELINKDPYGKGWIYKLENISAGELNALLSAQDYEQFALEEESNK